MTHGIVHLLRHGDIEGGARYCGTTDVALTSEGLRKMEDAAGAGPWDRIVSSPRRRCRVFAESLAHATRAPLEFDERLSEMDFGAWEGRTAAELLVDDPEPLTLFWRDPLRYPPPRGEPLDRFAARVLAAWEEICDRGADGSLLVVTHGGPIRVILCRVHGIPITRLMEFKVEYASLHPIQRANNGPA